MLQIAGGTLQPKLAELRTNCEGARRALILAIAKARAWIDDLTAGRVGSFAEIADLENKAERHIRFLAPLAFISPQLVSAIANGETRANLNLTTLLKNAAWSWTE